MTELSRGKVYQPNAPFDGTITRDDIVARIKSIDLGDTPDEMRCNFARLVLGDALDPYDEPGGSRCLGAPVIEGLDGLTVLPHVDPLATGGAERYAPDRQVMWLHGGGYVFGSPETHLRPAAHLAQLTGTPVLLPRYPLAPEHSWPAPLEHVVGIAKRAAAGGVRIALAGDSAGGHLALVAALRLAREGTPVSALALMSPNTDRTGLNDTRGAMDDADPMVSDADDRALARKAFGDMPDDHPHVSPGLDDLALLPPTHVEVGDPEALLGDSLVLAERMRNTGAMLTLHVEPDFLHMGQLWTPWWPKAGASLERIATHLRRCLRVPLG